MSSSVGQIKQPSFVLAWNSTLNVSGAFLEWIWHTGTAILYGCSHSIQSWVANMSNLFMIVEVKLSHYSPCRWQGGEAHSSASFFTSALDGSEWSASRPGRALPRGKDPPVPIVQETGWAPELVWTQEAREKILSPLPGIEPRSPGRSPHSQTLHWVSYPAHLI
jgi:hypothetical protein